MLDTSQNSGKMPNKSVFLLTTWHTSVIYYSYFSCPLYLETHGTQQSVLTAIIYSCSKDKQVDREGRSPRQSLEEPMCRLPHALPAHEGHAEHTVPSAMKMQWQVYDVSAQGSPDSTPMVLCRAGHKGALWLVCTQIPDSQKESEDSA